MRNKRAILFLCLLASAPASWGATPVPPDSGIGQATHLQQRLINLLDSPVGIHQGAWRMDGTFVRPAEDLAPRCGNTALRFGAREVHQSGSKGDFCVSGPIPGKVHLLGLWMHLEAGSNIRKVGIQVYDGEGEALAVIVSADWAGWKWVEVDLYGGRVRQAYSQPDKNGRVDAPLASVHVVWFAGEPAPTRLGVDGLVASCRPEAGEPRMVLETGGQIGPDGHLAASAHIHNPSDLPIRITVTQVLEPAPDLHTTPREKVGTSIPVTVPARGFAVVPLECEPPLNVGAHRLSVWTDQPGSVPQGQYLFRHPGATPEVSERIGVNAARMELAPRLRELGVGWVRFENMKWPFVSPGAHQYAYDGSVPPWHVNTDRILQAYHDEGIRTLSYMFQTPDWCTSAPEDAAENMVHAFPPTDLSLYGEFCFQTAARYGSTAVDPERLLSRDQKSGLGLVGAFELWNEPNLNPSPAAAWGAWAADMDTYYRMMRHGAEAIKQADPHAVVTSAGYAGMRAEVVDPLRTYRYPDGRRPLDFVDVINVHYYSGKAAPETATADGNANIISSTTFVEDLQELRAWRDLHAPGKPIWMTETGYDSAGPFGTTEAIQAARLPRVVMLGLAHGIDNVFVYRESGSTPSRHAASGVLRNDYSPKPSWYTLGTLIRQFHGVTGGGERLPHPDERVWLVLWDRTNQPLLTAWTTEGTATLGIDLGPCRVTDAFGGWNDRKDTRSLELTTYPRYISNLIPSKGLGGLREDAQRQAEARFARAEQVRALQKYLFDFGNIDVIGSHYQDGVRTPFTPVLQNSLWDPETGFGFEQPPLGDEDRPWMGRYQKLDRDGVRVRNQVFRFRALPGDYTLSFLISPFQDGAVVVLSGTDTGEKELVVQKEGPAISLPIRLSGTHPEIRLQMKEQYAHFRWISCVERLPARP